MQHHISNSTTTGTDIKPQKPRRVSSSASAGSVSTGKSVSTSSKTTASRKSAAPKVAKITTKVTKTKRASSKKNTDPATVLKTRAKSTRSGVAATKRAAGSVRAAGSKAPVTGAKVNVSPGASARAVKKASHARGVPGGAGIATKTRNFAAKKKEEIIANMRNFLRSTSSKILEGYQRFMSMFTDNNRRS